MADHIRIAPEFEKWVAELTSRVQNAWQDGPALLGKAGFSIAVPGLDAAHQRHRIALQQARRAVGDVATSAKRLELRIGELERQAQNMTAPSQGAPDGPHQANRDITGQLVQLRRNYAEMKAKEERLTAPRRSRSTTPAGTGQLGAGPFSAAW